MQLIRHSCNINQISLRWNSLLLTYVHLLWFSIIINWILLKYPDTADRLSTIIWHSVHIWWNIILSSVCCPKINLIQWNKSSLWLYAINAIDFMCSLSSEAVVTQGGLFSIGKGVDQNEVVECMFECMEIYML